MLDIIKLINPQMRQSTTELLIVQIFIFSDFQHSQYDTPSAWPFPQSPLDQSSAIPVGQSCYLLLPGINVHHTQAPANHKREQTKDWAHDKDHEHKNSCPPHIKSLQNSEWMAHFADDVDTPLLSIFSSVSLSLPGVYAEGADTDMKLSGRP